MNFEGIYTNKYIYEDKTSINENIFAFSTLHHVLIQPFSVINFTISLWPFSCANIIAVLRNLKNFQVLLWIPKSMKKTLNLTNKYL